MKRTSGKLTTFLGKKLNQAVTVIEKTQATVLEKSVTQTRPPRPPSPPAPPTPPDPPQNGQPLYETPTADHAATWFDSSCDSMYTYQTPPAKHTANPPSNVSLDSPFPPDSPHHYPPSVSHSYTPSAPPATPRYEPVNQTRASTPGTPYLPPSPYTLPPTAHPVASTPSSARIPPPPPLSTPTDSSFPSPCFTQKATSLPERLHSATLPPRPSQSFDAPSPPGSPFPPQLFLSIQKRAKQASQHFPNLTLPVSRPLDPSNEADLELWRHQLQTAKHVAVHAMSTSSPSQLPTFALSFTPTASAFTEIQWNRLKYLLRALSSHCRSVCLVFPSPSHTRLLPPAIFPVMSLSTRHDDLSTESATQFWPFLEEVAGLWGGGVIYAAESRGAAVAGFRQVVSLVSRIELNVVECVNQVLRNIYFGAVDRHDGLCAEVIEIAKWAMRKGVCLGEHWRETVVKIVDGGLHALPPSGVFLDGSRTVDGESGNLWERDLRVGSMRKCIHVTTDRGGYFLVNRGEVDKEIWVLAGVDAGKVAWSKVMSGAGVTGLVGFDGGEWKCVERAIGGQVGRVTVFDCRECGVADICTTAHPFLV